MTIPSDQTTLLGGARMCLKYSGIIIILSLYTYHVAFTVVDMSVVCIPLGPMLGSGYLIKHNPLSMQAT